MAEKMNPEVKAKWIAALRSGKYKQGRGALRNLKNEYCCLGVLCEVARKEKAVGRPQKTDLGYRYAGDACALPPVVCDWAGLEHSNPKLGPVDAITLNDDRGYTFQEIADLIEEHL